MFHQFAESLRSNGIDARIFFAELNLRGPVKKQILFSSEGNVPTWRVSKWYPPKVHQSLIKGWAKAYIENVNEYIRQNGKPDVIHAQGYLSAIAASAIKKKIAISYIYTERSSRFVQGHISARYRPFIRDAFENANEITCVSPGFKERLEKYTNKTITVIPNYYNPGVFYFDPAIRKAEVFTWVSIGEPAKIKGLDVLIEAFGKIKALLPEKKMQLILVDHIYEKNELMALAKNLNIETHIQWKGLISQPELAGILRKSHVFISASRIETFGKAILEAQACGVPVVATKTDGANYILEQPSQGLLCEINSVDSLVEAMKNMIINYDKYEPQKIVDSVASRFSERVVMSQWQEFYHNILS